jgi:hypothetical protein
MSAVADKLAGSMIPIRDVINSPLRKGTTVGGGLLVSALGMPRFIFGSYVEMPAGRFEIAGGCIGLHFFVVSLA